MFQNFTSKPFWHQCWAIAVAVALVYFLARFILGSIGTREYALATFGFGSLVIDRFFLTRYSN
jgi:hypothetical protein